MKLLFENWQKFLKEYQGEHSAPTSDGGAPLWNVSDGIYPKDFYDHVGLRYYGTGSEFDREAYNIIRNAHGRRDKQVKIYRAVPKGIKDINEGDWVTISRGYAKEHGIRSLEDDYVILKKLVSARDLFTNGDSLLEWGYDPHERISYSEREDWEKWPGKKSRN